MEIQFDYYKKYLLLDFILVCDLDYRSPSKFDWSLPILIFMASLLLWIIARFEIVSSFDFQSKGVILDFKYSLAYCLLATMLIIPAFFWLDGV